MSDSRPNAVDGVVAGLVTGQVHKQAELLLSISGTPRRSLPFAPSSTVTLMPL